MSHAPPPAAGRTLNEILADIMTVLQSDELRSDPPERFHPWTGAQERALDPLLKELHPFEDALLLLVRQPDSNEAALVLTLKYWGLARRVYVRYRDGLITRMRDQGVELREIVDMSYQVIQQLIISYDPTKKLPLAAWLESWSHKRIQRQLWRLARQNGVVPKSEHRHRGFRIIEHNPEANAPIHNLGAYLAAITQSRGHLINMLKADLPGLSERSSFDEITRAVLRAGKRLEPRVWPRRRKLKTEALPQPYGDCIPLVILQDAALSEFLRTSVAQNQVRHLKWAREHDRRKEVFEAVYALGQPDDNDENLAGKLGVSRQEVSKARFRAVQLVMEAVLTAYQERIKAQITK